MIRAFAAAFALAAFCLAYLGGVFANVSPWVRLERGWWALGIGLGVGAVCGFCWRRWLGSDPSESAAELGHREGTS